MLAGPALLVAFVSANLAGLYQAQQMEVGAALELSKDGHFRYQLDYGAVSEQAQGDWVLEDGRILLTTRPMPKVPSFELVRDDPAPKGELMISVEPPGFGGNFRLDAFAVDADSGERGLVTTDEGGRIEAGKHRLASVDPLVPVFGTIGGHFPLAPERGHRLVLRFHPNDLGHAAFRGEPLQITSRGLVLKRYDTQIRFVRVRP